LSQLRLNITKIKNNSFIIINSLICKKKPQVNPI
jgi:hypothetical protein